MWSVTSAPASEPLDLADVKNYLKVTFSADDDFITDLITEARQFVERKTGRALITQTITEYFDSFTGTDNRFIDPRVILPSVAPVQSITSISYIAEDGTPSAYTTWANGSNENYWLDAISGINLIGPARIVKNPDVDWPEIEDFYNAVKVVYVAGYGATAVSVPGALKVAMRRLIGIWYYGRDWKNIDDYLVVKALIDPYTVTK